MPVIPPGFADVSVELRSTSLTRSAFLTFGVRLDGGLAADQTPQKVLDSITLDTPPSFLSPLDSDVTIVSVTARVGQDGDPLVYQIGASTVGLASAQGSCPANCAVLVHKRSARGGRRGRGRLYIPWYVSENNVDEAGKITTANIATLQTALNSWLAALTANNVPMCLLHTASQPGTEHPTATGAPDMVNSVIVDPVIGTQRRRLGR